jgi:nucleotide-binding universal stress UspA family protein
MSETERAAPTGSQQTGPVLAAVDFSQDSHAALAWAGEYARLTEAKLLVLHVAHDPAASPGFYRRMGDEWLRPMVEVAEEMLAEFLEAMRKVHPDLGPLQTASTKLVSGLPAGRIVEVAEQVGAPLIVVGSRGRTGLPHILLGSVAERVVQTAAVPVVVVKAPPESCKNH